MLANLPDVLGEGSSFLSFMKGDLIVLEQENGEAVMNSGWCYGECARNGRRGDFPAECVYVLPTITKPPPEILVRIYCIIYIIYFRMMKSIWIEVMSMHSLRCTLDLTWKYTNQWTREKYWCIKNGSKYVEGMKWGSTLWTGSTFMLS